MYMRAGLQADIAFHLSGMRPGSELTPIDRLGLFPALLARHRDLAGLRYDFPLVLLRDGSGPETVEPLGALLDAACREANDTTGGALGVHALRLEREMRAALPSHTDASLSGLFGIAADRMMAEDAGLYRDSIARLRAALKTDGAVIDCDKVMPFRLCHHYWETTHRQKARHFRDVAGRLVVKLADILRADFVRSPEGLNPANLEAAMGTAQRGTFDFGALSQLLSRTTSKTSLSETRRHRIRWLLIALETQRFFPPLTENSEQHAPYNFVFENTTDAMAAYRERSTQMVELSKAIAMAGLEIAGEYDERHHDPFFAGYGIDNLDTGDFGLLPDYLILTHMTDIQPAEAEALLNAFAAGMRAKVLVQTDDILAPPAFIGGNISLAVRTRQIVNAAIGLGEFYVLQAPASHLPQSRERLANGFAYPGPALFSVFSGAMGTSGTALPPYLLAAAALEARAFPAFTYDPSAGSDWPSRFRLDDTPQAESDWPSYPFAYEDADYQRTVEDTAFTLADFVACDARYFKHFARVPRKDWTDAMLPLAAFLGQDERAAARKVPYLLMADADGALHRVIVDDKVIQSVRRTAAMWHGLQELAGLRGLRQASQSGETSEPRTVAPTAPDAAASPEPAPLAAHSAADAYIETARCSSCNECVRLNPKMFTYNDNQQAYIKDARAGTYRQLVEAAESCALSIIHPGEPLNPDEAGLDDLVKRAQPFL